MIEEEKRKEELKKRMEEIQREKRERKLRQRQLQRNKERETKKDNEKQKSEDIEMSGESQSEGKSSNLAEDFIITPKNAQKGRKNRTFENKQKREGAGKEEKSEILFEKEWQKGMENTKLIDFTSDPFLNEKIYAFLQNPSETEKRQLDIGVFVNELWHRMEAIGQLTKFDGILEMEKAEIAIKRKKVVKLEEKWTEMKRELAKQKSIRNQSQIEGVIRKLYYLLMQIIAMGEGNKDNCEEMEERNTVQKQWATVMQEVKGVKWEGNTFTAFTNEIPKSDVDSLNVALDILKFVINEWSNGTARLVVSGSHFLGTRSSDSDIDTICVVPQKGSFGEEKAKFSGTFTCVLAIPLEQRICEDNSLYCRLCKHPKIKHLSKFPSVHLHLIQLNLLGVEFDLSLVSVPDMEFLPDEPLEPIDVELMMEVLANQRMPSEVMIKSLAGYLANHQIIGLIAERNRPKFRRFVVALKHWAKRSHIYGNIFGFFNGTILCILAAKVILWYPNGSVHFLFQKFMLIYATWNWPMPVQLTEQIGGDGAFDAFAWNPSADGQKSQMPIITPGKLTQNCANNVNGSTVKILQNEMREAHLRLAKTDSESANFGQLFPPKNFIEKFHHFLLISCTVSTKYQIWQFCGFVGRKIRQQLANLDIIMGRFVHYSHVMPTKDGTNWADSDDKCPETVRLLNKDFDSPFCKFWIVGLKTKEENIDTKTEHETFLKEINEKLKIEFNTKIFNEYRAKVLKGWMNQAVKLETKYSKGDELAEFLRNF
ncbi:hypothetical protein niasHT_009772 [Heterodera trifolii]|uniref:polynucleotide adenylyltransferase n=1 Tax=Heterodera trifolii TaxID=157864 RepID=A0ABD2MDS9_9BILA